MENEETQATVMGRVIERLYFGVRPPQSVLATNGSILKRLHRQGYDWERLARVVEGLAIRRNRGELEPTIRRQDPVDLRWLTSAKIALNQMAVCEDAFYKHQPAPQAPTRGGAANRISDLLGRTSWLSGIRSPSRPLNSVASGSKPREEAPMETPSSKRPPSTLSRRSTGPKRA